MANTFEQVIPMAQDEPYSKILLDAIRVCKDYKPRFGSQKKGYSLEEFKELYGKDPFYSWMGLDLPLLYSAHKAAGCMSSIYRQIGIGCQNLFSRILMDYVGLTKEEASWSYTIGSSGREHTLCFDGRIPIDSVKNVELKTKIQNWMVEEGKRIKISREVFSVLKGIVFEVRQEYKRKDSERKKADLANASMVYKEAYLPVTLLVSNQIDTDVATIYELQGWVILRGAVSGSPLTSSYAFSKEILGYDLAGFFERNSPKFKIEVENVLTMLLPP
jgi:hypothetical protein